MRAFRFGVVATAQGTGRRWRDEVRRVADLGFSSIVMPDGAQLLSPFPALGMAAAISDLRVGTFVLAGPLRPAQTTAWEAHSLTVLTDGRFEMGIGTGLPRIKDHVESLGLRYGTGAERLAQVEAVIDAVRERAGAGLRTPVLVAARGPKALSMAGRKADIVTLAAGPLAGVGELAEMADLVRAAAGDRADDLEFATNIFVVGDDVPAEVARYIGVDSQTLAEHRSMALLRGSADEMAEELGRRRELLGISYVLVNSVFADRLAPVAAILAGR